MTELSIRIFEPDAPLDRGGLTAMYRDYLIESYTHGWHGGGAPLAPWLRTVMLRVDDCPIGFMSVDTRRVSIELIYVHPAFRRKGAAGAAVRGLQKASPMQLKLKGPVTPDGEILAESLGLTIVRNETSEHAAMLASSRAEDRKALRLMSTLCPHRHPQPFMPCRSCMKIGFEKASQKVISDALREMSARRDT